MPKLDGSLAILAFHSNTEEHRPKKSAQNKTTPFPPQVSAIHLPTQSLHSLYHGRLAGEEKTNKHVLIAARSVCFPQGWTQYEYATPDAEHHISSIPYLHDGGGALTPRSSAREPEIGQLRTVRQHLRHVHVRFSKIASWEKEQTKIIATRKDP